ncbi:hypothetical protein N1851_024237 [Merluccius polli]|uniref:Uncharacterized protein n=1 Tax=Merluccius polli TaxID=89951 RepID=A0AA47NVV6_MERPO|nr:hypothetical protein N1851_024237 [Merluccius polli]
MVMFPVQWIHQNQQAGYKLRKTLRQKRNLLHLPHPVLRYDLTPITFYSWIQVNPASSKGVKVKTFEEIMREKRLRKQELEEQASSSPCPSPHSKETEPPQKRAPVPFLKKTLPIKAKDVPPAATSPSSSSSQSSDGLSTRLSPPIRKRISLKSKADSPSAHSPSTVRTAPTSPQHPALADSGSQSPGDVPSPSDQGVNSCSVLTQIKQTKRMACQEKSPGQTTEIKGTQFHSNVLLVLLKLQDNVLYTLYCPFLIIVLYFLAVRPKLNVKPSVIKPAAQVKPGQKRKLAVRSAVAEVKPLNSTSTVTEEPQCKQTEISPTNEETQPSPAVTQSPASLLGSALGTSPAKEEPQTVPIFQHGPVQNLPDIIKANDAPASREACTVPQSPIMKTPTQAKQRRTSFVASRVSITSSASAVDDFDELMNEFTDDHLGEDMDPGMGEDDLLQELSEMIDS